MTPSLPGVNIGFVFYTLMKPITLAIATGMGTGYSPVAPGTAGSLLGLPLAYLLARLGHPWHPILIGLLFIVGVWASGRAEEHFGQKDPGKIVIDEVVGILITLYLVPVTPLYFALGFVLFRIFDISKPFPVSRIDAGIKGGWGIMLDDVAAAVYANICLQGARALL